jgi:hypothetical protein
VLALRLRKIKLKTLKNLFLIGNRTLQLIPNAKGWKEEEKSGLVCVLNL